MTAPHDDWDDEERALLERLEDDLDAVRLRHAGDPPVDVIAAASGDALPPEWQALVQAHLDASPWSRAMLEGAALPEDALDEGAVARIQARVIHATRGGTPGRGRWGMSLMLSGALAASAMVGLLLWPRSVAELPPVPPGAPLTSSGRVPAPLPSARASLPLDKPEVRLQLSSLTWRRTADENPYVQALVPAFAAYRADDYRAAVEAFDALVSRFPDAFEVHFYGGISRLFLGAAEPAIASLTAAAPLADADMTAEVQWYLAVAEQRAALENTAEARLRELCRDGGAWGTRACVAIAAWHDGTPPAPARTPTPEPE